MTPSGPPGHARYCGKLHWELLDSHTENCLEQTKEVNSGLCFQGDDLILKRKNAKQAAISNVRKYYLPEKASLKYGKHIKREVGEEEKGQATKSSFLLSLEG